MTLALVVVVKNLRNAVGSKIKIIKINMEKQLNFLNIFDGKDEEGEVNKKEDVGAKLKEQKEVEMDRSEQENENNEHQVQLEHLLVRINEDKDSLRLSDFQPFLSELKEYHERFQSFKRALQEAKPGLDKERIYRKIVNPSAEDEPEFRAIATLYLAYLEKLKEPKVKDRSGAPMTNKEKTTRGRKSGVKSTFWSSPKFNRGKDAAAGAYLDYKE